MPSFRDRTPLPRWPKFRSGELVRVIDIKGRPEEDVGLLGREGVVDGFGPDREGRGWIVSVRFGPTPVSGTHWDSHNFWEEALEGTGFAETDAGRVPLNPDQDEHADSFLELVIGLFVPITEEPLDRPCRRATEACTQLLPDARIDGNGEVDSSYSDHWRIWLEIRPSGSSREAFEYLAASFDHWQRKWDNGWSCSFSWWRKSAEPGEEGFLLSEADSVFLDLLPYSDPSYWPVPQGRNDGATSFQERLYGLPPPAGYLAEE